MARRKAKGWAKWWMREKGSRGGIFRRGVGEDLSVLLQVDGDLHAVLVVRLQEGEDAVCELGQDWGAPFPMLEMHQDSLVRHFFPNILGSNHFFLKKKRMGNTPAVYYTYIENRKE